MAMQDHSNPKSDSNDAELPELELTDGDILDAMQHIPGYLDISTEDFRTIYHLAHRHAAGRLFGNIRAEQLMRVDIEPLRPDMPLDEAARTLVRSGYKALPVTDAGDMVTGMLTENDFLRRLQVDTFLELLLNMLDEGFILKHRCHETLVSEAMSTPAITVFNDAGFMEIIAAFHQHIGRSVPVVGRDGKLQGLLLRKDFFSVYNPEDLR
jgi:CBS domain-containing membrane protein